MEQMHVPTQLTFQIFQEVKKLAKNVLRDFKKIDGLVNNAAYTTKEAKEKSDDRFWFIRKLSNKNLAKINRY